MSVTTPQNTLDAATVPPAADFGDTRSEFRALVTAAGVYELGARAKVSLTGGDRVRWLNGMVTNNIRDLAPGHGVYAFFLNPQGRIQADMYCFNRGEDLLIETDASQVDGLRAAFEKYIIMDDVEVADAENLTKLLVVGPKAMQVVGGVLGNTIETMPALEFRAVTHAGAPAMVVRLDDPFTPQFEFWIANEHAADLWKAFTAVGAVPIGYEALEMLRIWSGQ